MLCLLVAMQAPAQIIPSPAEDAPPAAEQVPVDAPPDEELEERVGSVLNEIQRFRGIQVDVRRGVVILEGEVDNVQVREDIAELVRRFEGVIWVDNRIEVATDVETRLAPALARVQRFGETALAFFPIALVVLLLIYLLWKLGSVIARWEAPATRFGWNPIVWALFRRMARAILLVVGLLLVFDILGVSAVVGAILGTAGVVGIALGFAFRDIAENHLAGVLLSIRQPFDINDLVEINGQTGFVVRLTSRELILLTLEGNHVRLPNASVFKSPMINYTRNPQRLFRFEFGIGPDEDITSAIQTGMSAIRHMPGVMREPPPFVRVRDIGESSIILRFNGWVDQREADFDKVRSEAIRLVKETFDAEGIAMPEPSYRIEIQQAEPGVERTRPLPVSIEDVMPDGRFDAQVRQEAERGTDENLLREGTGSSAEPND
ncbi:MAG: mechanosensitive ion channel family protein [Bacteroidota bacterium]